MLVKVLFNENPIKCFINIYYSLVAVVGYTHLPRRAHMKCSKVLLAGEGEETITGLFVFTAWCEVPIQIWCANGKGPCRVGCPPSTQCSVAGGLW